MSLTDPTPENQAALGELISESVASLIARLEAASEGGRELDYAIRQAIGSVTIPFEPDPRCWAGLAADGSIYQAHERGGCAGDFYLPFYTTSLDAALTLVPEGRDWLLRNKVGGLFLASVGEKSGTAPTPALALCIAALKARAAE